MTTTNTNSGASDTGSIFDPYTTDPDKLKMQADAMLFASDLQVNQVLNQQWTSLLGNIKSKLDANPPADADKQAVYKEKVKIINNFLAQKGYDTTAVYVLELTKTDFYEAHLKESLPNDESDRFVQDILAKTALLAGWQDAIQKATDTDTTAPDQFLTQLGYKCTAKQVNGSFKKMRDVDLKFWTGIYGNTVMTTADGKTETGPVVVIYDSLDGISIGSDMLDKDLNKVTYKDGVLSWSKDDFTVTYSGQLTFSQVTRAAKDDKDAYVGNEFFGTITYKNSDGTDRKENMFGRIGKPPQNSDGSHGGERKSCPTPPSVQLSIVDKAMKYIGYFMAAVFIVDFVASVPKRFKSISEYMEKTKKPNEEQKPEVEKELENRKQEIEASSDPKKLENNGSFVENIDGAQPENFNNKQGLDFISDEQLPPAENVQVLEQGVKNMNENGEIKQSEENVQEDPDPVEDNYQGNEEDIYDGISNLFEEV